MNRMPANWQYDLAREKEKKELLLIKGGASEPIDAGEGYGYAGELRYFLDCIRTAGVPVVTGEAGLMALETAMRITEQVNHSLAERKPRR